MARNGSGNPGGVSRGRSIKAKLLALTLAVGAAVVVPASPALAARRVVITGGGWGHGLGLSQWGAYARAMNGAGAKAILKHYYSNTTVGKVKLPPMVRVGLLQEQTVVEFGSRRARSGSGKLSFEVKGQEPFAIGGPGASWRVEPAGSGAVRVFKNGTSIRRDGDATFGTRSHPVLLRYEDLGSVVKVVDNGNQYRHGLMVLESYGGSCGSGRCLRLIAKVGMEDYALGISEVSPYWPLEAQRVQAIIARTYATYKIRNDGQHRSGCNCAVYDNSYDQVYIGDDRRIESGTYWPTWKKAVVSTAGTAVLHNGAPILSLYMSSSGGHTEDNEEVWGGTPLPYLRGVPDRADAVSDNVNHTWRESMSWSEFSSRLDAYFGTGSLQRFVLKRPFGVSGRVTVVKSRTEGGVRIVGSAKTVRASGYQVKSALGLNDTLFRVKIVD